MAKKEEIIDNKQAKLQALQAAMSKIEKDYGKGSIMKLGDDNIEKVDVFELARQYPEAFSKVYDKDTGQVAETVIIMDEEA